MRALPSARSASHFTTLTYDFGRRTACRAEWDRPCCVSSGIGGRSHLTMEIFKANKDQLSDPDKIKPGQVLKIPAAN